MTINNGQHLRQEDFKVVRGSHGRAIEFAVTSGLQSQQHGTITYHTEDQAVSLIQGYLRQCLIEGQLCLSGKVTTARYISAWKEEESGDEEVIKAKNEVRLTYSGTLSPRYSAMHSKHQVEDFLNGLASVLGAAFRQPNVEVSYDGDKWILVHKDKEIAVALR